VILILIHKMNDMKNLRIIGISVETTNEKEQSTEDIGLLWNKFFADNISSLIPEKMTEDIYSIYTNYETDHTGKYMFILGYKVSSLENVPQGLVGFEILEESYKRFVVKGKLPNALIQKWKQIWNDNSFERKFSTDFEIHKVKSPQEESSEVEIFLAVK